MNMSTTSTSPRGLGDVIERITTFTGIKAVVEAVAGEECGCGARRDALNELVPFGRVQSQGDGDGVREADSDRHDTDAGLHDDIHPG